ncbi:28kDa domain protein [Burkholderia mallei]|nr:28kDa domain protein [Burkholderia mallei]
MPSSGTETAKPGTAMLAQMQNRRAGPHLRVRRHTGRETMRPLDREAEEIGVERLRLPPGENARHRNRANQAAGVRPRYRSCAARSARAAPAPES